MGMAFTHQYRFAAAESVEKEKAPKAISIINAIRYRCSFFRNNVQSNYTKNLVY